MIPFSVKEKTNPFARRRGVDLGDVLHHEAGDRYEVAQGDLLERSERINETSGDGARSLFLGELEIPGSPVAIAFLHAPYPKNQPQ